MGEHLNSEPADEQFEDNHLGCMSGILHALDYHHWNLKKYNGSIHAKGNGKPKARLNAYDSDEVQKLLDTEAGRFLIDPSITKTSSINKRSLRARIKALISEEISKDESYKRGDSSLPSQSRLQRTNSFHRLELSVCDPHGKSTGWHHPIIFLPKKSDTIAGRSQAQAHMKGTKKPAYCNEQFVENHTQSPGKCEEAKATSVNKGLFLKIQQDTDDGLANCFCNLQASDARARLTKSGSFPAADLSRSRNFRPSKLKHKQNEAWASLPKGEKLFAGTRELKLVSSMISKDLSTKSELLMTDDIGGEVLNHDAFFSSTDSAQGLDEQASNNDKSSICHEIDGSVYDLRKVRRTRIRRTASLDESLERYAQLFQNSFSREAKLHLSKCKSLKLTNEYEIPLGGHIPISFKRVHSLPHLDSYCSLQNELPCDSHSSVIPISKNCESNNHYETNPVNIHGCTEKYVPREANRETDCYTVERTDGSLKKEYLASSTEIINEHDNAKIIGFGDKMGEQTVRESKLDKEQEITLAEIASNKLPQPKPVSVLRSSSTEDETSSADFPTSEGLECRSHDVGDKESSVDSECRSCSENPENINTANKNAKNHRHIELCTIDNADFNYVSNILKSSGFDGNGFLGPWHSMEQPLNPLLFEEVEAGWPHEPSCSGDETFAYWHHQLLFDLINEVLIQIYDSSITYYPRALSFSCRIRPMSMGYPFLEEVWERISRTLSSREGVGPSVDCVVTEDLRKDDGWMDLRLETECVALELEDMIFDELLEEITFP
ncbi:hypothetical protein U1Q18_033327 [Sarracenia purpurea var. burkii]